MYKAGDIYELKSIKDKLEKYHPESKEYTMVKDLVSKYEKEQQEKADAEKKERLQAVNKLRKKYDDINHITWYEK